MTLSALQYFIDDFEVSPEVLVEKLEESQRFCAVNANVLERKSQLEKLCAIKLNKRVSMIERSLEKLRIC